MSVGIIYYTSNRVNPEIKEGCWKQLQKAGLPITVNDKVVGKIGAVSMFKQILDCLERATETHVFFCEHDILYHPSHFEFIPPKDDTFYYNVNVWRWDYYSNRVITYAHMASVSGLCVNRELAMGFYRNRLRIIAERGYEQLPTFGNPVWARSMGYEPGKFNKEGESALKEEWRSIFPNIDIRHTKALTVPKLNINDFKRTPVEWREDTINNLSGWDKPWMLVRQ
jgi:hypothetical protein